LDAVFLARERRQAAGLFGVEGDELGLDRIDLGDFCAARAAVGGAGIGNFNNVNTEPTAIPVTRLRIIAFIFNSLV
jgi:hypothetical protein